MKYKIAALMPAFIVRYVPSRLRSWWVMGRVFRKYPNGLLAPNEGEETVLTGFSDAPLPEDIVAMYDRRSKADMSGNRKGI